jgi:hypothetical protein
MKSKLIIHNNGTKIWKLPNDKWHREDGPAFELIDGYKAWYIDGEKHREDGPAIEYSDGGEMWYLNDINYTEQEYKYKIRSIKLKLLL